ncbi:hypothetical protein [Aquimarina sp. 2201CG5-10]|uniref:hypothetical protein n=1 Tax=Aquimarina callyspongiae TaxID=3098150 RepID=UPI002AB4FFA1|nr:hypothetical protein [Aquimarina sp. 2201CG5-10]MDY8134997.1 hypothetical protein [Aquimarina sp. 2201CG5-10]
MLRNILNLEKVEKLGKKEQSSINGGMFNRADCAQNECSSSADCAGGGRCTSFDQSKSCPSSPTVYICMPGIGIQ